MSCNFEIDMVLRKLIPTYLLLKSLEKTYGDFEITDVSEVDDWLYTNHRSITDNWCNVADNSIKSYKVVIINALFYGKKSGLLINRVNDEYRYSFWIQMHDESDTIYDSAVNFVISHVDLSNVIFVAMGYEMLSPKNFMTDIFSNKTVHTWLVPNSNNNMDITGFKKSIKRDCTVFSRMRSFQ